MAKQSNSIFQTNGHLPKKHIVFFDFDNTITKLDVVDELLKRFSVDDKWKVLEKKWLKGELNSKDCLEGQLRSVRISKKELEKFLASIPIDPYFSKIIDLLKTKKIPFAVVSDGFDVIIQSIFKRYDLHQIEVCANRISLKGNRLFPSFPHRARDCKHCAHCKKKHLIPHRDKITVYVGDGLSDVCPAQHAKLVFAKDRLLSHLRKNKIPCVKFDNLKKVHSDLKKLLSEPSN